MRPDDKASNKRAKELRGLLRSGLSGPAGYYANPIGSSHLLSAAHDITVAYIEKDEEYLANLLFDVYDYLEKDGRAMHGQEFSPVYWRYWVISIETIRRVAHAYEAKGTEEMCRQWLRSFVAVCALSAAPVRHFKSSAHSLQPTGKNKKGIPCTAMIGWSSFLYAGGGTSKSLYHVDTTMHAMWMEYMLGLRTISSTKSAGSWEDGGLVRTVYEALDKVFGKSPTLLSKERLLLYDLIFGGVSREEFDKVTRWVKWGTNKPFTIGRTKKAAWTVAKESWGPDFMQAKVYNAREKRYAVYGPGDPRKKGTHETGKSKVYRDYMWADVSPAFDFETNHMFRSLLVPLPTDNLLWMVGIAPGGWQWTQWRPSRQVPPAPPPPAPPKKEKNWLRAVWGWLKRQWD